MVRNRPTRTQGLHIAPGVKADDHVSEFSVQHVRVAWRLAEHRQGLQLQIGQVFRMFHAATSILREIRTLSGAH